MVKRRGALTLNDIMMLFVGIIVLSQLMPTIKEYTSQAAAQATGLEAVFWNMIPWVLVLGLLATIVHKASTPRREYE